jgi:N-acetylmuramoyl-L-alanine amidase
MKTKKINNEKFSIKSLKKSNRRFILIIVFSLFIIGSFSAAAITLKNTNSSADFSNIKIYLSPSNQYSNSYAYGDTNEMEQCEKIAASACKYMEKYGFTVMIGTSGAELDMRCSESDSFNADLHIPIHTNALDGEYTGGTRIYVYDESSDTVANYFLDSIGKISIGKDDLIDYKPSFYEINTPVAKTVYVECEFHDTHDGAKWIVNNTEKLGMAIADAVYNYYSNLNE